MGLILEAIQKFFGWGEFEEDPPPFKEMVAYLRCATGRQLVVYKEGNDVVAAFPPLTAEWTQCQGRAASAIDAVNLALSAAGAIEEELDYETTNEVGALFHALVADGNIVTVEIDDGVDVHVEVLGTKGFKHGFGDTFTEAVEDIQTDAFKQVMGGVERVWNLLHT